SVSYPLSLHDALPIYSSLNHNDIGLEYVKDSSGKFVPINGSTIQVTNEGLARSLGSNRASDLKLPEEWDTSYSKYAYKGAIVSTDRKSTRLNSSHVSI